LGWKWFGNKCYFVSGMKSTQKKAGEICSKMNGDLVSIHSKTENDFVQSMLGRVDLQEHYRYWLGAERVGNDQFQFQWSDGSTFKYSHWHRNDPNNVNNEENCVSMVRGIGREAVWIDDNCNKSGYAICQRSREQQLFVQMLHDLQNQTLLGDYLFISFDKQKKKINHHIYTIYKALVDVEKFFRENSQSVDQLNKAMKHIQTDVDTVEHTQKAN
ncbi:hypothetical protein B4U80_12515, partial [Leptotrombidium deliense]